jgi:hypothetical protein
VADVGWSVLEKWQEARLQDDNGVIAIRFGLAATLYFRDGHTLEKRRAALACFEDYDRLCGSALNWVLRERQLGTDACSEETA